MNDQLKDHFDKFDKQLSKYQCGFTIGFSTQYCLLAMIEKLQKSLDSGWASATFLTDLSKAFDCLLHDLLIAKLHVHVVKKEFLYLLFSYLKNRKQRVRFNNTYIEWVEILFGVPQRSMLGSLLFNVFLCGHFLFLTTTPHIVLV